MPLFSPTATIVLLSHAFRSSSSLAHHRLPNRALPMTPPTSNDIAHHNHPTITILGFGSLLSPSSARLTFPTLQNFRLGRVPHHRRVFAHPASVFFHRNIANLDTLEMSSLSVEYAPGHSFVCSVFEIPRSEWEDATGDDGWVPSRAFLEREEEFDLVMVPYGEVGEDSCETTVEDDVAAEQTSKGLPVRTDTSVSSHTSESSSGERSHERRRGVICRRSTDEAYIERWGRSHFDEQYTKYGIDTIWNWSRDSGLKPCSVYLRHCVLASRRCGEECYASFLDETYLVDRRTTIREYLRLNPGVLEVLPPEELRERYGG